MRILFLSQWFYPEPGTKVLPLANSLNKKGYDVEVLTGFPNYPGGRIYPGYKIHLFQKEIINGIRVKRVALFPSHDRSGFKRILNYLSFSLSTFFLGPFLVTKPDIVYVYNLITLAFTALLFKKKWKCKIVYDVQDLWPESVISSGMLSNRFLFGILERWSRWAYLLSDEIAVLSPGFKRALIEKGVPEERIKVIYNWSDESSQHIRCKDNSFEKQWQINDTFNVVFAGTMGKMQGLDIVLKTAHRCASEIPNIRFVLVGGGTEVERLKLKARELNLRNVIFIPRLPMNEMHKVWSVADILLVHLIDDPLFRITIPSKLQAYLATGIPIVMAVRGDAAKLISESGGGVICKPDNVLELFNAIKSIYDMPEEDRNQMGKKGRQFYNSHLSFEVGCKKFLELLGKKEKDNCQ